MEFSSFFFHLLFFSLIFQLSNTIVSSTKVEIPAQNSPTDKLDSLTEQIDENDADIGKRQVQQRIKRDNEDVVYIDHRLSGCISTPLSQNFCDASYAFATVSFYEWLSCQKTGQFYPFSEQYLIDCGHRLGNFGCRGGNPAKAVMFVKECGFVLQQYYPFTGIQGRCPYDDEFPPEEIPSLRLNEPNVIFIPLTQLEQHLEFGPIIVVIEINRNFLLYRGGVDENVGHTPELLHTMLLIGHGREDGKDYWMFKNSQFIPGVGDGLYKLNKDVDCLRMENGIGMRGPILG